MKMSTQDIVDWIQGLERISDDADAVMDAATQTSNTMAYMAAEA